MGNHAHQSLTLIQTIALWRVFDRTAASSILVFSNVHSGAVLTTDSVDASQTFSNGWVSHHDCALIRPLLTDQHNAALQSRGRSANKKLGLSDLGMSD